MVRTRGYFEGDCVEATVQATDGGDIVEGRKTLTLHGRVDKAGVAYFKEPLRRYTLILSDGDKDAPGRTRQAPALRPDATAAWKAAAGRPQGTRSGLCLIMPSNTRSRSGSHLAPASRCRISMICACVRAG